MQNGLVTVVVPIYNVEKYLNRCLNSIVNQTYKNLEIILVDDGSPDNCPMMCDEWAKKDTRIKVIHKANAGLGMARNTGIENASGEYICFFDSDDYIDLSLIEKAYNTAVKQGVDVVVYGMAQVDRFGKVTKKIIPISEQTLYKGKDVQEKFLPDLIECSNKDAKIQNIPLSAWSCLFSAELIKRSRWQFVSEREIISEDSYSLISLYNYVNSVYIISEALYFYCENQASLTNTYRSDRYEKLKIFYKETCELAKRLEYSNVVLKRIACLFYSYTIGALKLVIKADMSRKEQKKDIKRILFDETMVDALRIAENNYKSFAKTILFRAMKHRMCALVYILVKLQLSRE